MDPVKSLVEVLEAAIEWNGGTGEPYARERMLEALENLTVWVRGGGFLPKVTSHQLPLEEGGVEKIVFQIG